MKRVNPKIIRLVYKKLKKYLLVFLFFFILFVISLIWLYQKTAESERQIAELKQKLLPSSESINQQTVLALENRAVKLGSFLPDKFNLYQVINLIEQISNKTKFKIQSYDLKYVEVSPNALQQQSLSLQGSGTLDQFMAFLKEYKFITGKLLTIDSVNLSGDKRLLSNLNVNIYAYLPEISVGNQVIPSLDQVDQEILKKVDQFYTTTNESNIEENYKSKKNPFEN